MKKLFKEKPSLVVAILIVLYISTFIFISLWKYNNFGYNAIDLAIFDQVFYNTSVGNLFSMTIHPHSYLGDHFGLIILLFTPIYAIFKSPVVLLFLQTIVIALSALPLYLIAKKVADSKIGLIVVTIFLMNPFIQNMNLFEFHLLPFAMFTLLFAFYSYITDRFKLFLLFSVLSLLIREDISLVIIMFSVLSWIDRKNLKWILTPVILGATWLITVFWIVPMLNDYDTYKFIFYYSWLGESIGEIIKNLFLNPLLVLSHLFSLQNIFLTVALFLPFLLLPFLKPKYLLLSLLVFLQLLLGSFSGELILKTHYSAPILVSVFITMIYAFNYVYREIDDNKAGWKYKIKNYLSNEPMLFSVILFAVTIYATTTFGPIVPAIQAISNQKNNYPEFVELKSNFIKQIPKNGSVTASYDLLPQFSNREELYSLHYAFLSRKQYSNEYYSLPPSEYMIIDTKDFLTYQVQYPDDSFYENAYSEGDNNIRSIIENQNLKVSSIIDDLVLFENSSNNIELYKKNPSNYNLLDNKISVAPEIMLTGWNHLDANSIENPTYNIPFKILPISFYWKTIDDINENYQIRLSVKDSDNNTTYEKYYALGYGIFPSTEWDNNSLVQTNHWFLIPENVFTKSNNDISFNLVKIKEDQSHLGLNGLLTAQTKNIEYESVGESFIVPLQE